MEKYAQKLQYHYTVYKVMKILISGRNWKIQSPEWDSFILFLFSPTCWADGLMVIFILLWLRMLL